MTFVCQGKIPVFADNSKEGLLAFLLKPVPSSGRVGFVLPYTVAGQ